MKQDYSPVGFLQMLVWVCEHRTEDINFSSPDNLVLLSFEVSCRLLKICRNQCWFVDHLDNCEQLVTPTSQILNFDVSQSNNTHKYFFHENLLVDIICEKSYLLILIEQFDIISVINAELCHIYIAAHKYIFKQREKNTAHSIRSMVIELGDLYERHCEKIFWFNLF